jgi:hypothetical protein
MHRFCPHNISVIIINGSQAHHRILHRHLTITTLEIASVSSLLSHHPWVAHNNNKIGGIPQVQFRMIGINLLYHYHNTTTLPRRHRHGVYRPMFVMSSWIGMSR